MSLSAEVKALEAAWKEFGVEVYLVLREREKLLILLKILVPEDDRKQGLGTQVMTELTQFADEHGLRMALTPATDFGATSRARLERFYRRFGFEKNKDYAISESMLRDARENPGMGMEQAHREPRRRLGKGVPSWTLVIHENKARLEEVLSEIMGQPTKIKDMLGCGHWGCVFKIQGPIASGNSPWVVKFSRDPTEGPIWNVLKEAIEDEGPGSELLDGIARVKAIGQIKGGVHFRRKQHPLYLIVREDVMPVRREPKPGDDWDEVRSGWTKHSLELFEKMLKEQHPSRFLSAQAIHDGMTPTLEDVARNVDKALYYLSVYRVAAYDMHRSKQKWFRVSRESDWAPGGVSRRSTWSEHRDLQRKAENNMLHAINRLQEFEFAQAISQTLDDLYGREIYLRDVHHMNIGWRTQPEIDGVKYEVDQLVIFDPGHTPTSDEHPIPEIEL